MLRAGLAATGRAQAAAAAAIADSLFFTRVIYGQHLKPVLKLKAYLPLPARESGISPSLLIIVIIIFVAVVGGLMRCMALVVP